MQRVKGSVLKARLAFVEEHGGTAPVGRVLAALGPDARAALGTVLTMKWYPFELGQHLDEAIGRALELCGATGVQVVEEECRARGGAVCRYRVSWR